MLQLKVCESLHALQNRNLLENTHTEALCGTPFQGEAWLGSWSEHYLCGNELRILQLFEGKECVGEAAFYIQRGLWRGLRWIGTGASDYLQPLVNKEYETLFAEHIFEYISENKAIDLIDFHQIREGQPLLEVGSIGDSILQAQCGVLDLKEGWDIYLKTLGKSLRFDVKKLDKEPFKSQQATFWTANSGSVQKAYDILFYLHAKRWKKRGLPGVFLSRKNQEFHRRYGAEAVKKNQIRLNVLEYAGEPIGVIYAMKFGKTTYFYQCGFDPAQKSLSPGTLLIAYSIKQAIDEGQNHFDFMRGIESYKLRWKPQTITANYRLMIPKTRLGELGASWCRLSAKAEKRIRDRFEGRGLLS